MTAPSAPSFEERLAALRVQWQALWPQRLQDLRDRLAACRAEPGDDLALGELHRAVHTIAGSAGTFGHPTLSRTARVLEHELERVMALAARTAADFDTAAAGLDTLARASDGG